MRTCPHCQFLVLDEATACSVCHGSLATTDAVGAVGAPRAEFVAPGQQGAAPSTATLPPPFQGAATSHYFPGPPGSMPAPARNGGSGGRRVVAVLAVLGVFGVLGLFGVLALFTIGTTSELTGTDPIVADDLDWSTYVDPAGDFDVSLPGEAQADTVEYPDGVGGTTSVEAVTVRDPRFVLTLTRSPGVVQDGASFDTLPFSPTAAQRGAELNGMDDAQLVSHGVVEGSDGSALDAELRGTLSGREALLLSRVVISDGDLYELGVIGPADQQAALSELQRRFSESFVPAAGA